jgi:hypothetical protein
MKTVTSLATLLSALLMASIGVSQAGAVVPTWAPAAGDVRHDPDVGPLLDSINEQFKRLSVSVHNLAEMRDGLARENFNDTERARLGDIFAVYNSFRKTLAAALTVGPLIAKMRLPEDANTVGQTFYLAATNAHYLTESDITDLNRYMTDIHNAAALAQVTKVRDAMGAIRDILQAVPHFGTGAAHQKWIPESDHQAVVSTT